MGTRTAMEIVLFRIRTRPDIDEKAYTDTFERMLPLVSKQAGFVSLEVFVGEGGDEVVLATFEDEEAICRWRDQPEHVEARRRGREEFFAAYGITIATVRRQYHWSLESPSK